MLVAAVLSSAAAGDAAAYRADPNIVPQPVIRWYTQLSDWKKPFGRVVRALNRADVGVRLVQAKIPERASIQIGRLKTRCGYPGVQGVTQSIAGGFAAIYLPALCKGTAASVVAAHELGHALGLLHEDRGCALMNSSGTGPKLIPTQCFGKGFNWYRKPFRLDDLRGLRRLYRNTAPTVALALDEPGQPVVVNRSVGFDREAEDRERNISEVRIDFGDGDVETAFELDELPANHTYVEPGMYTVALTATDLYGRTATSRITIQVEG